MPRAQVLVSGAPSSATARHLRTHRRDTASTRFTWFHQYSDPRSVPLTAVSATAPESNWSRSTGPHKQHTAASAVSWALIGMHRHGVRKTTPKTVACTSKIPIGTVHTQLRTSPFPVFNGVASFVDVHAMTNPTTTVPSRASNPNRSAGQRSNASPSCLSSWTRSEHLIHCCNLFLQAVAPREAHQQEYDHAQQQHRQQHHQLDLAVLPPHLAGQRPGRPHKALRLQVWSEGTRGAESSHAVR